MQRRDSLTVSQLILIVILQNVKGGGDNCDGTIPANATSNATSEKKGISWNYNATAGVCTYKCNTDYTRDNATCKPKTTSTFTCMGTIPSNAMLIDGDDQGLTANTQRKVVASNTSAKCEYTCNAGYTFDNGNCAKLTTPSYTCQGDFKNAFRVYPGETLTENVQSTLVQNPTGAKCEWKCNDEYIKGINLSTKEDMCLQCQAGTWNPTDRTCKAISFCPPPLVPRPDVNDGGTLKCFPLGNCLDKDGNPSNDQPYYYSVFLPDSRPIAKNLKWEYVTTPLEKNACQYHCAEGAFYYNDRKRCEKTHCYWHSVDEKFAYFIDNVPSNQLYSGNISVPGKHLFPSDFENTKNLNPQPLGCYYTCKEDKYKYFWNNSMQCWSEERIKKYKDAENKSCKELPTGVDNGIEIKECPTIKDQNRTYVSDTTSFGSGCYNSGYYNSGCYWTCKEGYTKGSRNGIEGCYTKCEVNEYRYPTGFGWCSFCPNGKIGDEKSDKIFWNPTSCRDACADKPQTIWSSVGGLWGSCISSKPTTMQCPEGTTLVQISGKPGNRCLSCIPPQTLNTTEGKCE